MCVHAYAVCVLVCAYVCLCVLMCVLTCVYVLYTYYIYNISTYIYKVHDVNLYLPSLQGWNVIGNYTESLFGIRTKVLFITDRFNATQTMAYLQVRQ